MHRLRMLILSLRHDACAPNDGRAQQDSVPDEANAYRPHHTAQALSARRGRAGDQVGRSASVRRAGARSPSGPTVPTPSRCEQPKNRKFQTYGGEGYIYETSRAIFPKQSGELRIPRRSESVAASASVAMNASPLPCAARRLYSNVKPPPDIFSEDWWLVASATSRSTRVGRRPLDDLRVGDRVTRSIEVTVAGAFGAPTCRSSSQGRSTGLTVLPGRTKRSTEITPGGVIGRISRTFDLRIDVDRPINVSVPVRIVWWNTNTEIEAAKRCASAVRLEPLPRRCRESWWRS